MCDFDSDFDGLDWEDWMIIGPLSEGIANEKRERNRIRRENDRSDSDYRDIINERW